MTRHTNTTGISRTDDGLGRGEGRARWMPSLLSLALALPLGLLAPGAAQARIDSSDFLSRKTVKEMMNGTGRWGSDTHRVERPLGAKPARCRSDKPMGSYREARARRNFGKVRGAPTNDHRLVHVEIYRYDTRKAARKAMRLLKRYASDCPRTVEWTCTQCDGIFKAWRKPVAMRRVGQQSTAWRLRMKSDGLAKGYVIASRKKRTIVKATVENTRAPYYKRTRYPKAPAKSTTVAVARAALRKAT